MSPIGPTIASTHLDDQIGQGLEPQTIGAEFHMTGLMSCHHQIQPHILFSGRIAAQESRKPNGPAIWTDPGSHRYVWRERIGQRLNRELRATQSLYKQSDCARDLSQRQAAQRLLD